MNCDSIGFPPDHDPATESVQSVEADLTKVEVIARRSPPNLVSREVKYELRLVNGVWKVHAEFCRDGSKWRKLWSGLADAGKSEKSLPSKGQKAAVATPTTCHPDRKKLKVIAECLKTYGMAEYDNEWSWNVLSTKTVVLKCGTIQRGNALVSHEHDPAELNLCERLAKEASEQVKGIDVGMGSEESSGFRPFFVASCRCQAVPNKVTTKIIREKFGGTIYPKAKITVEPLLAPGSWWTQVVEDGVEENGQTPERYLKPWYRMIDWFSHTPELHGCCFVMIGEPPLDEDGKNGGCVFPRIALGITKSGSLVGLFGHVVKT